MNPPCADLISFADGALDVERAEAFRGHLRTCAACQAGLVEALQLSARLSKLDAKAEVMKVMSEALTLEAGKAPDARAARDIPALKPHADPRKLRSKTSRRLAPWVISAVAAAALVVALWPRSTVPAQGNAFAELKNRPYEIRFAYADAGRHLPPRDQMLGTSAADSERIPYAALDGFQKRNDRYALAIAQAVNGEKLTDVAALLLGLEASPSVRSDRAAIEIVRKGKDLASGDDNIESVLAELESLKRGSDPAAARAARWNYAIVLARLDLPLAAAQEFRAIAGDNEPGWSNEARSRAAAEAGRADVRTRWDAANAAGQALVKQGTPVPLELVQRFPGILRAYFYNAMCSAPSRERVLALAPMASELDRLNERAILSDHVTRVANRDFHRRQPLAEAYAQILRGAPVAAAARAALLDPRPAADVADITICAMFELDAIADHLDAFRAMVRQADDPWWEIVLAMNEASAHDRRGDRLAAEARLRKAEKLCSPAVRYRCLSLSVQLGHLYLALHRVPEAVAVIQDGLRSARSAGEWGHTQPLLMLLADAERFNSSIASARAYATETMLMSSVPDQQSRKAHMLLVGVAIRNLDGGAARRELALAMTGEQPYIAAANHLADIGRLDPQPGDLAQLQAWLGKLRDTGTLTAGERVLADEIEGRLLIETDPAAGIALLERVVAAAQALPGDVMASKARTGAHSVLAFEAARRGDHMRVMALIAQELGLPPPGPCTVGIAAEDERAAVVVRDSDGRHRGGYQLARRANDEAPRVPASLAHGLESCGHIRVMATPLVQGLPRALPAALPWSYATGTHGRSPQGDAPTGTHALIVANVTPPDYLHLEPLSPQLGDSMPRATMLSGPAATPAAVLAEMATASEIQFHTHALMGGMSDASHLVLSPGQDGSYALTAEAIRRTGLRGRPIVVLAACHSAQNARYQHAAWSLPDAFLSVGARAVFAAAESIPDQEAAAFFARVLHRTRAGVDPAVALRDERTAALAANPSSWATDVVLFE